MAKVQGNAVFTKLYKSLNKAQKQAVDTIEGPVIVVAGPGTGKTHVLTLRIANILRVTDTPPDGILALTFTEAAASNMRRRLAEIVGTSAYRVRIHTFHGYCQDVINRFPESFPRIIGSDPISDVERITIFSEIITNNMWEYLKPFGNALYYIPKLMQAISELKRENISPDQLDVYLRTEKTRFESIDDLYHEKGVHKGVMKGKYETQSNSLSRTQEVFKVYKLYVNELKKRRRYDFEDMVMEVVSKMETDKRLLLKLQEESLYVLADEHQDANYSQNRLLQLLSSFHENPNIFVVGDDKQAIFRFQGASLENFASFTTHFKGARIIALTESYRSGQPILDASHALMEKAGESLPLYKLQSRTGNNTATVEVTEFNDEHAERVGIADHIVRLVGEGIQPHEIAILYRRNSEAFAFAYELEKRNIATSIESDQNTLHDPDIRRFLVLLRSLAHFGSDEAILNVLHLPFIRIEPLDVYKVLRRARVRTQSIADVMSSAAELRDSKLKDKDAVRAVWAMLKKFTQSGGSVPQTVSDLIEESGFLAYILRSPHASDLLEKLGALVRDIETLAAANPDYTMENLVDHIELLEEHGVAISKKHGRKQVDAVRLMTAHRAKGLEFQYVFVVNVADGVWGGKSERSLFNLPTGGTQNSDEDERRILYVALTRAKFGVILSHPRLKESGTETLPSRLLEDIDANLLVRATPIHNETRGESLAKPRARARRSHAEVFFVRELFIEQGLSVTALNNYLTCPWEYFYTNLLRVPRTPSKEMLFGTIMHAALKRFFDTRNRKPRTNLTHLLTYMNEAIERTPLSRSDRAELSTRGAEFFSTWYEQYHTTWPKKTRSEYKVTTEMKVDIRNAPSSEMQSIPLRLRGDLDRIDITRGSHVHVVDYKTGQPKTRNAIMGLTKSETGDYWRQLIFYKLLLAREGKYIFDSAELNFLQPDRKGMHHIEHFEVPDTDVENMEKEIIRVVNEIWKLEFWNSRCDSKECEWCGLRELMG